MNRMIGNFMYIIIGVIIILFGILDLIALKIRKTQENDKRALL